MKRIFSILFALVLVVSMSLIPATPVMAQIDRHVGPGQTYGTIQAAVNDANPGDTIIVHEGTYTEQVNIAKSLTITGAGQDTTHIVSPSPTTMVIYDYFGSKAGSNVRYLGHRGANIPVVRIAASDVTFEGFHVDLDNQVFWDVLGTGSDSTYSKGVGILVDHVETTAGTPDLFTGITIQNNKIDGLLWNDYGDGIKVLAQATVNINHNTIYGYGESAVSAQGVDSPTRAAFYPTVTANSNTLYGGTNARSGNHYFFGIGYWSGAAGSADDNTIDNAPNNNGYALNSWTPNPVSFTNNIICTDGGAVGGYGAQLYESSNLIFSGNDVQDQGLAGAIYLNPTVTITNNNISNCIDGFIGDGLTAGSVTLHYNSFEGTASGHYALDMAGNGVSIWGTADPSTITADALYNWWGDASGPTHSGNSGGTGDEVSDYVDYDPWSFTPDPCEAKTIGFWKTHPESVEAVFQYLVPDPFELGGYPVEDSPEAIEILKSARAKNANEMLAAQLLAAKLNRLHLDHLDIDSSCFDDPIDDADEFLTAQNYEYPDPVKPDKTDKHEANELKDALDSVNNSGCVGCP